MSSTLPPGAGDAGRQWKEVLAAGPDCVPLDRLAETELVAVERTHVDSCPRCQAERALLMAFEAAEPSADEGAAVEWIARETKRRVFPEVGVVEPRQARGGHWFRLPAWATSMAAAVAIAWGVYLVVRAPGPEVVVGEPGAVYRAAGVELVSPVGEVPVVPGEVRWQPLGGAARYQVRVLEVDGTEIWRTTTSEVSAALPEAVRAAAKPARTLTWSVSALDSSGRVIGEPGTASFRVVPTPGI